MFRVLFRSPSQMFRVLIRAPEGRRCLGVCCGVTEIAGIGLAVEPCAFETQCCGREAALCQGRNALVLSSEMSNLLP